MLYGFSSLLVKRRFVAPENRVRSPEIPKNVNSEFVSQVNLKN